MNIQNLLAQILNSRNPMQMLMNTMTPQQQQMAKTFLAKPNRQEALQDLMKEKGVSQEQVDNLKKFIK